MTDPVRRPEAGVQQTSHQNRPQVFVSLHLTVFYRQLQLRYDIVQAPKRTVDSHYRLRLLYVKLVFTTRLGSNVVSNVNKGIPVWLLRQGSLEGLH